MLAANYFAFSNPSVLGARVFLFLGLAFALAAALIVPVIRLNRRRAARTAEHKCPQFEERLLTFSERVEQNPSDPFLELLAADTLSVAEQAEPKEIARTAWIFSFSSAAAASALVLLWLATSGPGFLGYGTSLLWGGVPKGGVKPYYDIQVEPGNRTVRKRSDQAITARLVGFTAPKVRFFAKYASASQWEQAEMGTEPGGSAYQFLIAGVPESLEYYVEAGGVRSSSYKLNVVDLPSVKNIRVTYRYPAWTGMKDRVENPGGDLRAVEGTTAEVAIQTDKPLATGAILLDDGSKLALRQGGASELVASVPIQKDGLYHVAAVENGEDVRLSEDYFIEAQKHAPAGSENRAAGPRFPRHAHRGSHRPGGSQGRFRPEGRRPALLREWRRGEDGFHAAGQGRQEFFRNHGDCARGFQSGAGRHRQPVRHRQGCARDQQHRYVLHRGAALRAELLAIPAGRRRRRRRRRPGRPAEPDFAAPEGDHHGHLEPAQGLGRQGQRCGKRGVPFLGAVETARPGEFPLRADEGPPD